LSALSGSTVTGGPTKQTFSFGFAALHHFGNLDIDVETGRGGEKHQQFELSRHRDGLFDRDFVRRGVDYFAVGQHAGGIAEPDGIPVGFDLPRSGPAGTRTSIEAFERRRIQKQRSHAEDTIVGRRLAAGELSEVIGPVAIESDRESRRLRLRRIAEEIYVAMSPEDKTFLAAYARGVNAYIVSHRGHYGFEFTLLNYDPRSWSAVDSLLVGLQMFRTLTSDWKTKLVKEQMLRDGEPDKVNYLFPIRSGLEFVPGGDAHPGSNAWAVAGSHTASGKPLLSSDMHLEFSIPGIWHIVHLQAPGLNVAGVELPGVPGVIVGHNDRIAWGVTNLGFDVQDLYKERIDLRTGKYVFRNQLEQARAEREVILIKGRAPEEMSMWVTRHGPVFDMEHGSVMSLKWTAGDPSIFHNIFLDVDRARNWDEFKAALAKFGGPGQNFVYADVDGNIGYHATGKLPVRHNYYGDVPVDGSTGENEWEGYIPFDELPQAWNPNNGFVVTANQNPFPADYPYHVAGGFAPQYRSRQILDMLRAGAGKLKPADTLKIQKDVYSGFQKFLGQQIVAAYDRRGAKGRAVIACRRDVADVGRPDGSRPGGASDHGADVSVPS
jgi:penicillin amidase